MTSPRPYVAAAAAAVLAALFFVPSASASPDHAVSSAKTAAHASVTTTHADSGGQHIGLADTGSIDTKPYVIGGAAFLVAGAGLIVNAGRRTRQSL